MRSYTDRAGADGTEWKIDLNAEMPSFSQRKVPFANEFDYSLYLNHTTVEKKFPYGKQRDSRILRRSGESFLKVM